jgi:predicted unusual protein kinase regulating ubiquinone biosynthesis (AarF/ABC1/UbiB family)
MARKSSRRPSSKRVPASRARRTLKSAIIAVRLAKEIISDRLGGGASELQDSDVAKIARNAGALLETMGEMKGLVTKFGQMLSFMDLGLAPQLRHVPAGLQDSVPSMSPQTISEVIAEELGAPPEEFFAEWDEHPFASASIGQVHRALMHGGTEVAVKVQYPQIVEALESDLRNVAMLQMAGSLLSPGQDHGALIGELRQRFLEECDYLQEASNQSAFRSLYETHPYIMVPEVISDCCTRRVLITRMVHGVRFKNFAATSSQAERDHAGAVIWEFIMRSAYRHGIVNCDPHPGNYLFLPNGRIAFLDFGCVKRMPAALAANWRASARAALARDRSRFDELALKSGAVSKPARFDFDHNWKMWVYSNRPIIYDRPFRYTHEYVAESFARISGDRHNASGANIPADALFLVRVYWGLCSVLAELRAEGNWRRLSLPFLYEEDEAIPPPFEEGVD